MTIIASFVYSLVKWTPLIILVGVLLDFGAYPREQLQIQKWLQDWWNRFNSISWRSFGKEEARTAIEYYDRYFGPRLFSRQRWIATLLLCSVGFMISALWAFLSVSYRQAPLVPIHETNLALIGSMTIRSSMVRLAIVLLIIPLSLSLTRYLCTLVLKVPERYAFFGFAGLLAFHVALLIWWTPIVDVFSELPALISLAGTLPVRSELVSLQQRELAELANCVTYFHGYCLSLYFSLGVRGCADLIANGVRIAFAAVFFGSFVAGPLIKEPIARVWWRIAQVKKRVFAYTFAGFSAFVFALDRALQHALG